MLLDRTHRTWAFISAAIMAVATVSYVIYAESTPKGPSGGSLMGLIYGVVGSLMMIYAGLLGGRKQFPFWRLGSAQFWLRGHIWFGTLSFPLILFHAGFGLGGLLEQILMGFFFVVWLSGFFGLAMQHFMPKLLTSRIGRETFAVQIPYIRKRNRILADRMVSVDCGKVPLDGDPMQKDLTKLGTFAADILAKEKLAKGKAAKDEVSEQKSEWLKQVPADDVGLFQDLAKHAKNEGWINKIGNFPDQIVAIYELPTADSGSKDAGSADAPVEAATARPGTQAGGSPLDQMKGKKAASPLDQMKAKKAASPLDQMKAQRAMSPLEQMKAKVAAAEGGESKAKPKSPLEMMKAKAAAGKPPVGGGKVKPASPLDMARKMGAAGGGGAAVSDDAPAAPAAKLSPLEQARLQGAFGSGGTKKASLAPAAPAAKSPVKQVAPAPAPKKSMKPEPVSALVENVDAEISAVHKLLTEKYGLDDALARTAAEKTRQFLKTDPEADIAAIKLLFVEKYGYDESKAADIAEKVRPFVDGSAEKAAEEKAEQAAAAKVAAAPQPAPPKPDTGGEPATGAKLSPLELARQQGAVGSGGAKKTASAASAAPDSGDTSKKLSPLEQMKAKAAAGKPAAAGGKPLSPLEMMKAKAGGGKPATAGGKPLSPLEMMKAKAGGGKPAAGGDKPKSPLEMMKSKTGADASKPKAAKPVAKKPPALVKKKAPPKRPVLRTEELRSFYLKTVRPFLADNGRKGRLGDITEASRAFAQMRGTLPVELHDTLESLQSFCEEQRQFAEQIRIRAWLHYWLAIHIPFSIALFVLFFAHVVLALRVVPWDFPIRF